MLGLLGPPAGGVSPPVPAGPGDVVAVEPEVRTTLAAEGEADFVIEFDRRADLAGAAAITDWAARGRHVVEQLKAAAAEAQKAVTTDLTKRGVPFTSYWVNNSLFVHGGDAAALAAVAARPEVAKVTAPETVPLPEPEPAPDEASMSAAAVEWGIADIGADRVWSELDVRGEGVVVGSIDTGVDHDHPALLAAYRGQAADGTVTHDYSWFDPTGVCADGVPCDNHGHGTHTMGTMVGSDGADNQIGVAPGATWVSAKGCAVDTCAQEHLVAAGQWMLAPTDAAGGNPDPALRPHLVNNSWGGTGSSTFYQPVVEAWREAGMFPVFSNGNSGPACGTVETPAAYVNSFGVGAYDANGAIAGFSSRGPGPFGEETKPNLSAPGVAVRSAAPGTGYREMDGTSMAAPHVSGAIALVWSRSAVLRGNLAETERLLADTARDVEDTTCGGDVDDNNTWGEGRLDAFAAVSGAPAGEAGLITGRVTDQSDGSPIEAAQVAVADRRTVSDAEGRYTLFTASGDREVTVSAFGYAEVTRDVQVPPDGGVVAADFALEPVPSHVVSGTVRDGGDHGWPVYARVEVKDRPETRVYSDPVTGRWELSLPEGEQTLVVSSPTYGYPATEQPVTSTPDAEPIDVALAPGCPTLGYSSACESLGARGLVVGHVRAAADGEPIDGATVTVGTGTSETNTSQPTPLDDALDDGFVALIGEPGAQEITITSPGYQTKSIPVELVEGEITVLDAHLDAARLEVTTSGLDHTLPYGEQATGQVTITNTGTAAATVKLNERSRLDTTAGTPAGIVRTPVEQPDNPDALVQPVEIEHRPAAPAPAAGEVTLAPPAPSTTSADPEWEAIGNLHRGIMNQGTAAIDGIVYAVGGAVPLHDYSSYILDTNDVVTYDPLTNSGWDGRPGMRFGRWAPAAAAVDGLLYVTGGRDYDVVDSIDSDGQPSEDYLMSPGLEIFDPSTNRWQLRAGPPETRYHAAGVALDGQFYVIAGVGSGLSDAVDRYDPRADEWTRVAPYPVRTAWLVCGADGGFIYCAGDGQTHRYDPDQNAWTRLADMPVALSYTAGAMVNGRLVLSGGLVEVDGQTYLTNEGYAYDPFRDEWAAIPPAPRQAYRHSAACGFYRFGGYSPGTPRPMDERGEGLPGLDTCGETPDVPWLSLDRTELTLAPGETATVDVGIDSTALTAPGTELGSIALAHGTPDELAPVPVTLRVTDSPRAAKIAVSLEAIGRCDTEAPRSPDGATITVSNSAGTRTVRAGNDGTATIWAMPGSGRTTVTATAPGHQPASVSNVRLLPGRTTDTGLTQRQVAPCAAVTPGEVSVSVPQGESTTVDLPLGNTGTASYQATIAETPAQLRARPADSTVSVPGATGSLAGAAAPAAGLPEEWQRAVTDYPETAQYSGIRMVSCDGRPDRLVAVDHIRMFVYEPTRGTWSETPRMPGTDLSGAGVVCDVDEIHVLGGAGFYSPRFEHYVYNLSTKTWRVAQSLPSGRDTAVAGIWDGRIYLAGGYTSNGATDIVEVYDTATNTWSETQAAPMPTGVFNAAHTQVGHYLYVAGGQDATIYETTRTQRLNMITGQWEVGPDLPQTLWRHRLAGTDTALYLLGGYDSDSVQLLDRVHRLELADWSGGAWQPADPMPEPAAYHGTGCTESLTGGEIWAVGGQQSAPGVKGGAAYFRPVHGERCDTIVRDVPWLSSSETSVQVEPDASVTAELTVDAGSLPKGTHHATVLVRTDDYGASEVRIPITVTVT